MEIKEVGVQDPCSYKVNYLLTILPNNNEKEQHNDTFIIQINLLYKYIQQ